MASRPATIVPLGKKWTDEELMALPNDGYKRELVDGEIVMSPAGYEHGRQITRLLVALLAHADTNNLGDVVEGQSGFRMKSGDVLCPDISFVAKNRVAALGQRPAGFFPGAPDLAVEVLSPGENRKTAERKIRLYFENGTRLAWLVDMRRQVVLAYTSVTQKEELGTDQFLDGQAVLPGFRFPVQRLFAGFEPGPVR